MNRNRFLLFIFLFVSGGLCDFAYAQSVQSGLWRIESDFKVIGIPLPSAEKEYCIPADDAKDLKKTLTRELSRKGCVPTQWVAKGQRLDIKLKCDKDGIEATGSLSGTVSEKAYDLKGKAKGTFKNVPTRATLRLKGQRRAAC